MIAPTVSVITSSYNCAGVLPDCVASVLSQSFDSWEHIIIDCGSTDNSLQVLEMLKHPRLRIIKEDFCGVARARNLAIQQAQGEFCAILDADDLALPHRLSLQIELLRGNSELVAVGGGIQAIYSRDILWKRALWGKKRTFQYPYHHDEITLFLQSILCPIPHSTLTFRKKVFWEVGGYREAMEKAEDFDLILRFGLYGRLAGVPKKVGILHLGAVSSLSARHRLDRRDEIYYSVSSLLFNIVQVNGLKCSQEDIEEWLDGIGKQGINALRERWLWNNLMKSETHLSLASRVFFLKALILNLAAIVVCRNQPWWFASCSPESILKKCIILTEKKMGDD